MEFKLLVMVKNLCARNIIQNSVQGIPRARGATAPPNPPPRPVESDKSGVDGFAFFRLGYFGYSDLQSSATFIFKVGFLEPYLMTIIGLIITLQSLQI